MPKRCLLPLVLSLPACLAQAPLDPPPPGVPTVVEGGGVVYRVLVPAFADGDGDGVGDLEGLRFRLDYLEGLGVKVIRTMPLFPAADVAGLDVTSFEAIDRVLGDGEELRRLRIDAAERGMVVLTELPVDHVHATHPAFVAAAANREATERSAFWFRDAPGAGWWEAPAGDWYYAPAGADLPMLRWEADGALSLLEPALQATIEAGGEAWLGLDAAAAEGATDRLLHAADEGEVHLADLGEASPDALAAVLPPTGQAGPGLLAHPLRGDTLVDVLTAATPTPWWTLLAAESAPAAHWSPQVSSPAGQRFVDRLAEPAQRRAAMVVHLLQPGVPELYYGDELGLHDDGQLGALGAFPWAALDDPGFRDVEPGLAALVRELIDLRSECEAARAGVLSRWDTGSERVLSFQRTTRREALLVLVNLGAASTEPLRLPPADPWTDLTAGATPLPCAQGCVTESLAGYAYRVLTAGAAGVHDIPAP